MVAAGMATVHTNPQCSSQSSLSSTSFIFPKSLSHLHILPISNQISCNRSKRLLKSLDQLSSVCRNEIFLRKNPIFQHNLNPLLVFCKNSKNQNSSEAAMDSWRNWCLCVSLLGEEIKEGVRVSEEFENQREGRKKDMLYHRREVATVPFQFVQATRLPDWCKLGGMPNIISGTPKGYSFKKRFITRNMCSPEKMKVVYRKAAEEFKISPRDCGSSPVQIARLTMKIKYLSSVLHKKARCRVVIG